MAADRRPPVLALMGPTASGKTALALEIAQRFGGEVVSVDSALVYRRLDTGSAKPTAAERAAVPHHLIDLREPWEPYSAADFARDAAAAIAGILARGRLPLLVGGTGLYFRALLDGLSPMPESDPAMRARLQAELAQRGSAALHAELAAVDPLAATRIRPGDAQRIVRALEVWRLGGVPISALQAQSAPPRHPFRVLRLALAPADRALLHARIAQRFDLMLDAGLLEEVAALRAEPRVHAELPALRAVGYRQVWRYLAGDTDRAGLREEGIAATRQLAKRQLTWLRGESDVFWCDPLQAPQRAWQLLQAFLPVQ